MPYFVSYPSVGQPQGAYRSASSRLANSMTDLFDPRDLSFRQLMQGRPPANVSSTITKVTEQKGRAAKFNGSGGAAGSSNGVTIGDSTDYSGLSQSWLVIANVVLPSSGNYSIIIGKHDSAQSKNGWGIYISSSGLFDLFTKNQSTGASDAQITPSLPNGFAAISVSLSSTKSIISINGKITSVSNSGVFTNSSTNPLFIGDSQDSFWHTFAGSVYAVAGWNGISLTESECHNLSVNPWQIFAPSSMYLFGGAAPPAPTIYEFQSFSRGVGRGIARGIA